MAEHVEAVLLRKELCMLEHYFESLAVLSLLARDLTAAAALRETYRRLARP